MVLAVLAMLAALAAIAETAALAMGGPPQQGLPWKLAGLITARVPPCSHPRPRKCEAWAFSLCISL